MPNEIVIEKADARNLPLPDDFIQCVVTSPPYWGLRKYDGQQGESPFGLEPSLQSYLNTTVQILSEVRRVLKDDGVVFWVIGDTYAGGGNNRCNHSPLFDKQASNRGATGQCADIGPSRFVKENGLKPKDLCLVPQRVAIAAQESGWWVRSDIIWHKTNPMPHSVTDRPTNAYEHVLMLTKSAHYYWDKDAVAEPAKYAGDVKKLGRKSLSKGQANGMNVIASGNGLKDTVTVADKRNIRDVWTFAKQCFKGAHFATFPEELVRRCVLAGSREDDYVLDPFAGSGTVGVVCRDLKRNCFLFDLAYQEIAERRVNA